MAPRVLDPILLKSFDETTVSWGQQIFREVARAADHVEREMDATAASHLNEHLNLAHSLTTMLGSGAIQQIDVSVEGCDCSISISTGALLGEEAFFAADHADHALGERQQSEQFIVATHGIFSGDVTGHQSFGPEDDLVSFTPEFSRSDGSPVLALHDHPFRAGTTLASVSVTREVAGGSLLHVRLLKDISATSQALNLVFWMAAGAIFALAVIAARFMVRAAQATASGRMTQERARYLAEHDDLTGLFNRHGFGEKAGKVLDVGRKSGRQVALVQFDLDRFKDINDSHGHAAGDAVLSGLADLFRDVFPDDAVLARLGGDEFAAIVGDWMISEPLGAFLQNLPTEHTLSRDDAANLPAFLCTFSGGYAISPGDGTALPALMKSADLALYAVKWSSRNAIGGYTPNLGRAFERRMWEIDGIRRGVERDQIVPYYQPILNAQTNEIEGFESLIRWEHPDLGVLSPARFVNALEDVTTSLLITEAMLGQVTADIAKWRNDGYYFSVGLNVGEADLRQDDFAQIIEEALARQNCPPEVLAIEVTESAANRFNIEDLNVTLGKLRENGMFVALDDFGTGGSSISILKHMPCTAMKIDKSFVSGMTVNAEDLSIVRALTDLGHDLGLRIVAEGVETEDQAALLRELGVDMLQGYLFGPAIPARDVDRMLKRRAIAPKRKDAAA